MPAYSTRLVKMDSATRVPLEANLARNASRGASRVSLDNKPQAMPLEPSTINRAQLMSRKFREADS